MAKKDLVTEIVRENEVSLEKPERVRTRTSQDEGGPTRTSITNDRDTREGKQSVEKR